MKKLKLLVPIILMLFSSIVFAQTDVSLPTFEDLPVGEEVVVTVSSGAISNIYSLSLFIGYDTNVLEFIGIENNPFTSNFLLGDNTGELAFSWFSLNPASVTDKFFDLRFKYLGGSTDLEFVKTNQITDLSSPMNINFINGAIIDNSEPPAKEIELKSPNGGEAWAKGSTQTISWTDNFNENVKIELWKAGAYLKDIVASTASDGSYAWTLTHSLVEAADYKIKIVHIDSANVFDISAATFEVAPAPPLFLTLLSPNGGEEWEQSTTKTIRWNDNIDGNVKIELIKSLAYHSDISASTESDGAYTWTIPSDLSLGVDYSIKITSIDSIEINDESNTQFSIIEYNNPPVVSDIPDQTIKQGESFITINLDNYVSDLNNADNDITWTYSGNSELNVQISNRIATISAPNESWIGEELIAFTATDPLNAYDSDDAKFKVESSFNPDNPTLTIADVEAVVGSEILIPIKSSPISEIGSITLFISFDPAVLEYVGIENNPFTGNFLANDNGGEIAISWFSLNPVEITGDFFDLKFKYKGGSTDLTFTGTNQVTDMSTAIDMNFIGGSVSLDPFNPDNPSIAIGSVSGVGGSEVIVPVLADSLGEVGSLTMFISFDKNVLEYVGIENNPFTGNFLANDNGGELAISWFSLNPVEITEKLFDIKFNYLGGTSELSFTGTNQITDMSSNITVNYIKGSVTPQIGPAISEILDQTILEGEEFAEIKLDEYVQDSNNTDEEITWTVQNNSDLIFNIEERVLSVEIPNEDWFGVDTISLIAADPSELKDTTTVIFTVENVNDLPVIAEIPDTMLYNNGDPIELDLWSFITDVDNEISTLNINFVVSNDSLEIIYDDASGFITIEANIAYLGQVDVTVEVSDTSEEVVSETFTVIVDTDTDVYDEDAIPTEYTLYQNYPNPFNPTTKVSFGLPQNSNVKIEVFDILGNLVTKLVDAPMSAGNHTVQFNAVNLTSGTYFYRIETSNFVEVKKMLLLK